MFKYKRALLLFLIVGASGGGDHSQHHDRHPSQSKVRRWSSLIDKAIHIFD